MPRARKRNAVASHACVRTRGHEFSLHRVGFCRIVWHSVEFCRRRIWRRLLGCAAIGGRMTGEGCARVVPRLAGWMFRALWLSPRDMVSRSGHSSRVVREFCFVKFDSAGLRFLCGHGYGCASDGAGVDSRLRGNDAWVGAGMTWVGAGMAGVSAGMMRVSVSMTWWVWVRE